MYHFRHCNYGQQEMFGKRVVASVFDQAPWMIPRADGTVHNADQYMLAQFSRMSVKIFVFVRQLSGVSVDLLDLVADKLGFIAVPAIATALPNYTFSGSVGQVWFTSNG